MECHCNRSGGPAVTPRRAGAVRPSRAGLVARNRTPVSIRPSACNRASGSPAGGRPRSAGRSGRELDAGRRRADQPHAVALRLEILVDVAEHHPAHFAGGGRASRTAHRHCAARCGRSRGCRPAPGGDAGTRARAGPGGSPASRRPAPARCRQPPPGLVGTELSSSSRSQSCAPGPSGRRRCRRQGGAQGRRVVVVAGQAVEAEGEAVQRVAQTLIGPGTGSCARSPVTTTSLPPRSW